MKTPRTYLDWNASAPLKPEARQAMLAALDATGNASSVHAEGRNARAVTESARRDVAALVNAKPAEVFFTSGASESNNWVMSAGWARIVCAAIEHDSVLAPASRAAGNELIRLPVSRHGEAGLEGLEHAGPSEQSLFSLQMANNETGVVQPLAQSAAAARAKGYVVHSDGAQAPGRINVNFTELGVDMMSLSSHKIGGPQGAGALIVRDGLTGLAPFMLGGGQEGRRRAGTENVAAIAGFGAAARASLRDLDGAKTIAQRRDRLEREVLLMTPEAHIVGLGAGERLPNTASIALPGALAETMLIKFDLAGVAVSAGSACSSGKVGDSHVLAAMGLETALARSVIRVSIGPSTRDEDIGTFLNVWRNIAGSRQAAATAA